MNKNILNRIIISMLTVCLLLSGCGRKNPYPNLNADQIVFFKVYENWAEGYVYRANYITANGNVYTYEFEGDYGSDYYDVEDVFTFPLNDVTDTISSEQMSEMLFELSKVGEIEFNKVSFAQDYGAYTVYGVTYDEAGSYTIKKLGVFGDNHSIPEDKHARKICNMMGIEWERSK